jgi:hypothetical protein
VRSRRGQVSFHGETDAVFVPKLHLSIIDLRRRVFREELSMLVEHDVRHALIVQLEARVALNASPSKLLLECLRAATE